MKNVTKSYKQKKKNIKKATKRKPKSLLLLKTDPPECVIVDANKCKHSFIINTVWIKKTLAQKTVMLVQAPIAYFVGLT